VSPCLPREAAPFAHREPDIAGEPCFAWAGEFVAAAGGYLKDGAALTNCQYCPYATGDDFLAPLGISFDDRWRDRECSPLSATTIANISSSSFLPVGILIAFTVFNIVVTLVASKYLVSG
jgi:ATP-binding cassette subfamily G (WHITE) protein 2 (SNQ2)